MVELFGQHKEMESRKSSKGNQLKWEEQGIWYKADYTGYEGLAEYVISGLFAYSSLGGEEYVSYQTEEIVYGHNRYLGCKSRNFLPGGWKLITLERLFESVYGESLNRRIYTIREYEERVRFLVEETIRMTGLEAFGVYLSKLLTIDAVFLNEDRHTHNIAVLLDDVGHYHYCPIFDHGAALLADTTMDYPLAGDTISLMKEVRAKTICQDFDEQLDVVERLYGQHIQFSFDRKVVESMLAEEKYYPAESKRRVGTILMDQKRKYRYLFADESCE